MLGLNLTPLPQSDPPLIVNNVKKFMRYHIPAEVKISHGLRMASNGVGRSAGEAQIAAALSNGGPRNMRSEEQN